MSDLQQEYLNLSEDIVIGSTADGIPKVEEFFKIFSQLAAENGDCPDLTYAPILSGSGYRIDGYAFDIPTDIDGASGDLYLSICLYFQGGTLPIINASDVQKALSEVEKFLKLALSNKPLEELEESSYDFRLAMLIRSHINQIARVRVLVLTNAHLKMRKKFLDSSAINGLELLTNVLDIERYEKIASTGFDPVEIDLANDFSGGLSCIQASNNAAGYKSYLFAIPGSLLADIFKTYGNRLLEQNVRTYLQARTDVNKGILKTISDEPSMFFAYNNGLTATASAVNTSTAPDGSVLINYIKDFQIVNGGQTTASILYARDGLKYNLTEVFAQVKLSVVDEAKLGEIVPKISEYANTQNKVSKADLESNSAAQIKIERLSKEVNTPQRPGALYATKWFYERSRGQYRNLFAYKTQSQRNKLEAEFPKNQLIEKTDLAKFEFSFDGKPHIVSMGSQNCFSRYITGYLKLLNEADLNEVWYKCVVAKGILFRQLDKAIAQSEWYKNDKGLKAQTLTYTIAACAQSFRDQGHQIDLLRIWKEQEVPLTLLSWALDQASIVHKILNSPPGTVKNPAEFCKKEFCWSLHVRGRIAVPTNDILEFGVPLDIFAEEQINGRKSARRDGDIDFEIILAKLVPRAREIRSMAEERRLISTNNTRALEKLESGRLSFTKSEKNSMKNLFDRLGIDFSSF